MLGQSSGMLKLQVHTFGWPFICFALVHLSPLRWSAWIFLVDARNNDSKCWWQERTSRCYCECYQPFI